MASCMALHGTGASVDSLGVGAGVRVCGASIGGADALLNFRTAWRPVADLFESLTNALPMQQQTAGT